MNSTITQALQGLYKKMTGNTANGKTKVQILNEISASMGATKNSYTTAKCINDITDNYTPGGGGGGDFYEATITLANNTESTQHANIYLQDFSEKEGYYTGYYLDDESGIMNEMQDGLTAGDGRSTSFTVHILNGNAVMADYYDSDVPSLSGNAEFVEVNGYTYIRITGDCTITINY